MNNESLITPEYIKECYIPELIVTNLVNLGAE